MPPVDRQDDEDEEVADRGRAFQQVSCREKTASNGVNRDYIACTAESKSVPRPAMTSTELRNCSTRSGAARSIPTLAHAAGARACCESPVRGSRVCPRRSPPRATAGLPRGGARPGQDAGPDCGHRRANRRARPDAPRDARDQRAYDEVCRAGARSRPTTRTPGPSRSGRTTYAGQRHDPGCRRGHVGPSGRRRSVRHRRGDGQRRRHACYDVGVAGIHRLLAERARLASARVIIVVAGMEGALPSVVGGLVSRAGRSPCRRASATAPASAGSPRCWAC